MKRTLLFMACVLASLAMSAQEYYPEGTKWTEIRLDTLKYDSWYSKVGDEWVPNFETIEYYVKGEYIETGVEDPFTYKKVYSNGQEWTDSLMFGICETEYNGNNCVMTTVFVRDDESASYGCRWPGEAYQFDWSVGKGLYFTDITMSNTTSIWRTHPYYGIIDEIKEGYFGGVRPLKYVDLDGKAPANDPNYPIFNVDTQGGRMIQGIGITEWNDGECLFGPPNPYFASTGHYNIRHYRSRLVHFERNGEVLYDVWPDKLPQNNYIPLVKGGKTWHMVGSKGDECSMMKYMLKDEEVVKDGKTYFRLYSYGGVVHDLGLLREESRKVYFLDPSMTEEILLFDYSLKEGDTFETYSYDEQKKVSYKVMSVGGCQEGPEIIRYDYDEAADSMIIHRRYLRQWTVRSIDNTFEKTWIEGIGSYEGPLKNLYDASPISSAVYLAYVNDNNGDLYLPFSFHDSLWGLAYGCDLPTGEAGHSENDGHHHLTYELEGDRLHVYGEVYTQCGPNNYAYFIRDIDDIYGEYSVCKLNFTIQEVEPLADCMGLYATDFYVSGFDPTLNYVVVDNQGEEHPVIKKTPQNEYRPFVEDGKVWTIKVVANGGATTEEWTEFYYIDGDTIVNGQNAKRMLCDRVYATESENIYGEYVGACYEQDKKVYYSFYNGGIQFDFEQLYDFSLSTDDSITMPDGTVLVVNKLSGGIPGFKGTYYDLYYNSEGGKERWLEGVGSESWPWNNHPRWANGNIGILLTCSVGDEIIYYNSEVEDPYAMGAKKHRFDFTHTVKSQPKAPIEREMSDACISSSEREVARPKVKAPRRAAEQSLYGEYNDLQLGINLDPLDDAYLVRITDETGKAVYEKTINAGNIVALNIDISSYTEGRYTVTVENSQETFTGEFEAQTSGIVEVRSKWSEVSDVIYNLQGQRLSSLQKGVNIVNGKKVYVR